MAKGNGSGFWRLLLFRIVNYCYEKSKNKKNKEGRAACCVCITSFVVVYVILKFYDASRKGNVIMEYTIVYIHKKPQHQNV
jgi:hypothetical protein